MNRQNAHWMKREDERILEFLDAYGLASPSLIADEVFKKVSAGHVRERLELLRYAGLVALSGYNSYELTKDGKRYLRGELNANHQPTPTVEKVLKGY
jgi:Mn-dependent DtxR family transcriptional regulator